MDIVTKEATATVEPVQSSHPNGEFDVILSTDALDRDGERLYADEWKTPLPARINFDSDHGLTVEKTVGSGVPRIEDGQLRVRGVFASTPHAQAVRTLINEGHISATSVSYGERKSRKDAKTERELYNGSFVSVPANPEAVVMASKAKTSGSPAGQAPTDTPPTESDQQDVPSHDDLVQAIHDATVHLGASCEEDQTGESDGANKSLIYNRSSLVGLQGKAADTKPYGDVTYADPANGKYPVDTEEHDKSSGKSIAGSPQESAEESAAAAATTATKQVTAEPTAATDNPADDVATRARGLAFLQQKHLQELE